jgi:hypothetical protein
MLGRGSARRLVKTNLPNSFEHNPHEAMRENPRWTTQQYCEASCTRSCVGKTSFSCLPCSQTPDFRAPSVFSHPQTSWSLILSLAARFIMFKTYFLARWIAVGLCTMPCQTESMICVGVVFLDSQLTRALVASYSIFRRHIHGEDHRSVSRYTPAPGTEWKAHGLSS